MAPQEVNLISPFVKYLIFAFNFLFWLLGILIIALGLYSLADRWLTGEFSAKADVLQVLIDIPVMMVVVGVIIFIVSTAGCIGALRENTCLLKSYSGCLLLFFLAELAVAVCALIYPHVLIGFVNQELSEAVVRDYREKPDLQNLVDYTQHKFRCCGMTERYGYHDWSKNEYFFCNVTNPSVEKCGVPYSCCKSNGLDSDSNFINVMCGYDVQRMNETEARKRIYTEGCIPVITSWGTRNLNIIGGVAIGVAVAQLVVLYLARKLKSDISRQKALWDYDY